MNTTTTTSASFTGKIVQGNQQPLTEISCQSFNHSIEKFGVVLYRNFISDPVQFGKFSSNNSGRKILDPTRQTHHNHVQRVVIGTGSIDLHSEHSNSPFAPDYIWFYCSHAANSRGQTTIANGNAIWNNLTLKTQHFFRENKIYFERVFPEPVWKLFVASMLENVSANDVSINHLYQLFSNKHDTVINIEPDNAVRLIYSRYAFRDFGDCKLFFTNSIMGPYPGQSLSIKNKQSIPQSIFDELANVYERNTQEIPWQTGDVAVIDNHRFMHGRRESQDMKRELFSILSYKKQPTIDSQQGEVKQ